MRERLDVVCAGPANGVLVSLSHDQYRISSGGVQNCIAAEERALVAHGWVYLHLCPARPGPLPADAARDDPTALVMTLNGQREGVVLMADLLPILGKVAADGLSLRLVAHHLMGFAVETVRQIARVCAAAVPVVWAHDFFTLCLSPFFLRNDIAFCNAPPANSNACLVCCYGEERPAHVAALADAFAEFRPLVLLPSVAALDFWKRHTDFACTGVAVAPLARVEFGATRCERDPGRTLRVAHLGAPVGHKGWLVFRQLLERHANDPRYQFFRLGYGQTDLPGLTEVPVDVTPGYLDAMIDAVRDNAIDVAINWSSCFETFSFTALEAVAGGAFVVARQDAGNVWAAVAAAGPACGRGVRTEAELRALFITGEIVDLAASPRYYGRLRRSNGTADLLLNGALVG